MWLLKLKLQETDFDGIFLTPVSRNEVAIGPETGNNDCCPRVRRYDTSGGRHGGPRYDRPRQGASPDDRQSIPLLLWERRQHTFACGRKMADGLNSLSSKSAQSFRHPCQVRSSEELADPGASRRWHVQQRRLVLRCSEHVAIGMESDGLGILAAGGTSGM